MEIWLFILGYCIQLAGSCMLLWKIIQKKSIYGLSSDTQICFVLSTVSRCIWSLETRLVETWLAYMEVSLSTIIALVLTYYMIHLRHTTTKTAWGPLRWYTLTPITFMLAVVFHPGGQWISSQILVSFTMYTEALALLPQLYLMRKMIEIEPLTSHYVGLLMISRIVRLMFWASLYMQGEHFLGLFIADAMHSILSADYLYLWCMKIRDGGSLIYKV